MQLNIDEDFRDLISPLDNTTLRQLEENIKAEGCRDPLITWNGFIIDGHHRYGICISNNIDFKTIDYTDKLEDKQAVMNWMIDNQIGKRNSHPFELSYMRGKKYLMAKGRPQNGAGRTREILASELNVSKNTIERDAKFAQAVDLLTNYRTEILTGETDRTKQEIVAIHDFYIENKDNGFYDIELHVLYKNPESTTIISSDLKKINTLIEKYKDKELKELVKTDSTKEEDGREYVLWEAILENFDISTYIKEQLNKDYTLPTIEKALLTYIKSRTGIESRWIPTMSEDDFNAIRELEEEEARIAEREIYTPKLINGDTVKEMSKMEAESFDLIVTDPPYNMDKANWDSYGTAEQFADWMELWLKECFRVLKPHGSIYIFGLNRMLSHVQMRMEKIGFKYKNWIIWDTVQGAGGGLWVNRQEAILYFSKTDEPYEDKDAIKLHRAEENIREYKGKTYEFKNPSNIWRFPSVDDKNKERTSHPTQKPVDIMERIVLANSKEGDKILDCFMGSGTTGVACMKNKRRCIGIEMSQNYIDMAKNRFDKVRL